MIKRSRQESKFVKADGPAKPHPGRQAGVGKVTPKEKRGKKEDP